MKRSVVFLTIIAVLTLAAVANAQEPLPAIYVDLTEVEGLDENGAIPVGGTDLVIPIRFHNSDGVDDFRTSIFNGFYFDSPDGVTITGIGYEKNCDYNIDLQCAIANECYPFLNCYSWFDMYFDTVHISKGLGGIGVAGLTQNGTGLPPGFDDWIYKLTIEGVTGATGTHLILDSTSWWPAWTWMWDIPGIPSWGGPYEFTVGSAAPVITSTPPASSYCPGDPFYYDVDAIGTPPLTFMLTAAPEGMTIDPVTGEINWICGPPGIYVVTVQVVNDQGGDEQTFEIYVISCNEPSTTCWPNPIQLRALENERILNVSIWDEDFYEIDWSTIRVRDIRPYTEVRVEGDSLVTDVFVMQFLGSGGNYRPIPSQGLTDAVYSLSYTMKDGTPKTLYGLFDVVVIPGDVNFDGVVNLEDVVLMIDWLFNGGPKARLFNENMDECMDIDGSGRVDLLDVRALIEIIY